jgi:hypothetical protein
MWERDVARSVYEGLRRDLSHIDGTEVWMRLAPLTERQRAIVYTLLAAGATSAQGGAGGDLHDD